MQEGGRVRRRALGVGVGMGGTLINKHRGQQDRGLMNKHWGQRRKELGALRVRGG